MLNNNDLTERYMLTRWLKNPRIFLFRLTFLSDFPHLVIARQHHFLHSISVHGASFRPNSRDILITLTREN